MNSTDQLVGQESWLRLRPKFLSGCAAVVAVLILPDVIARFRILEGAALLSAALAILVGWFLLLVYLFPTVNGAHRWLRAGRIGVQPSEFAKVAFVCALGRYLMYRENYRRLADHNSRRSCLTSKDPGTRRFPQRH